MSVLLVKNKVQVLNVLNVLRPQPGSDPIFGVCGCGKGDVHEGMVGTKEYHMHHYTIAGL